MMSHRHTKPKKPLMHRIFGDIVPMIVIIGIISFCLIAATALIIAAFATNTIGGFSGEAITRAKQGCIDGIRREFDIAGETGTLVSAIDGKPVTTQTPEFTFTGMKDAFGTNLAYDLSGEKPFEHRYKIINLNAAQLPVVITDGANSTDGNGTNSNGINSDNTNTLTLTCIVNMSDASNPDTVLDTDTNVYVSLRQDNSAV